MIRSATRRSVSNQVSRTSGKGVSTGKGSEPSGSPFSSTSIDILDSLREGCQVIDFDYRYVYLNEAAARQGRAARGELIGRTMMDAYPGIDQTEMFSRLRSCMEQRTVLEFENEFTYPDGSSAWFELRLEPVPQGVFILSLDITPRKRAESDRLRLTTAIEHSAEAVIITDAAGAILYVNPAFEEVTGYSREEVLGANPNILKSGKQSAAFYHAMWAVLKAGKTWRGRLVNRRKDGSLITEDAAISPVYDHTGTIANYVCVKRDVSHEVRLEEQYRQAQKMEAVGQLAGGVAHDFNNLLAVVLGHADFLLASLEDGGEVAADVQAIRSAGEKAATLTRQLLTFSRKQVVDTEPVNLNDVITGMEQIFSRALGSAIDLRIDRGELANVRANRGQVEQVVMNLVVNARDAMPRGGRLTIKTAQVTLDERYASEHFDVAEGTYVTIAVADNGSGMDEKTKSRIFEPFFTTKGPERGTGLGLATVYGIVRQHKGNIWVYSEPGKGTTFKVYLPIDESRPPIATPRSTEAIRSTEGEQLLLVEDDPSVRSITERLLISAGYRVLSCASAVEALGELERGGVVVHLLLSDLMMPEMNGVELARRVRRSFPSIKVLYMSGYAEGSPDHFADLEPGAQFLGKPFGASELRRKVREVLDS